MEVQIPDFITDPTYRRKFLHVITLRLILEDRKSETGESKRCVHSGYFALGWRISALAYWHYRSSSQKWDFLLNDKDPEKYPRPKEMIDLVIAEAVRIYHSQDTQKED